MKFPVIETRGETHIGTEDGGDYCSAASCLQAGCLNTVCVVKK